jgi:hypothetical protein
MGAAAGVALVDACACYVRGALILWAPVRRRRRLQRQQVLLRAWGAARGAAQAPCALRVG